MQVVIKRNGKSYEIVQGVTVLETFEDFDEACIALAEIRGESVTVGDSERLPVTAGKYVLF